MTLSKHSILVFRIGHLGDTLVGLPAFWTLRKAFRSAQMTLLTNLDLRNPNYISPQNVLPASGLFDDWITYPSNIHGLRSQIAYAKLFLTLKRRRFDAVYYLMTRNRNADQINRDVRFFNLAGINNVIGTDFLRKHSLGTEIPKPTPKVVSESEFLLDMLDDADIVVDRDKLCNDLLLTDAEHDLAQQWLTSVVGKQETLARLIAVSPGSKWKSKVWDENRFASVVDELIGEFNVFPVVFGGIDDREKGERLIEHWGVGANAAGSLGVRESATLLRRCELYVGNDTGTMHLAAAVGTPCVAVFAAIDWIGRWAPTGAQNHIFRKSVECEGCHTPDCFNNHKCLDLISTNEVYQACRKVLAGRIKEGLERE